MAERNFNSKEALEREVKDLYLKFTQGAMDPAVATLDTTEPIEVTSVAVGEIANDVTLTIEVAAAAANTDDEVEVDVTGDADAIVVTVTPNDGTNNPDAAAEAVLNLTADITLESAAAGAGRNDSTFEIVVNAAAANDTDEVLVTFTGTAEAIVCTVTPNDGTNNGATPVALTTAQLAEVINTGDVAGYSGTIVLTDASSLRELQTATGGGATDLAAAGEGDGVSATFEGGTDIPVTITTAELAELLETGDVVAKNILLTDGDSLLDLIDTATGGDTDDLANGGEGDGVSATFEGGADNITLDSAHGFTSVERTAVGEYKIKLNSTYNQLRYARAILSDTTEADIRFQLKSQAVSTSSDPSLVIMSQAAATKTDVPDDASVLLKLEVKNTAGF